jgi:adenylate cyclase
MRLPVRLPEYRSYQRWLAAVVIAVSCAVVGVGLWAPVRVLGAVGMLDHVFYDSLFRLRPAEGKQDGPIVIVAVDDQSIEALGERKVGWPWPRKYWGQMVSYLDSAGAKAVVFDILFNQVSVYNHDKYSDDGRFAGAIDASATPVVLATYARPDGSTWEIAPPVTNKVVGATNLPQGNVIRDYAPVVNGRPSLALEVVKQLGAPPPPWGQGAEPFLLRYYGPYAKKDGKPATFRYVPAATLLEIADNPDVAAQRGLSPETFKNKVVFFATTTVGTYDLKSSPLSAQIPGVEAHATALLNLLDGQRVTLVGRGACVMVLLFACIASSIGTVFPPQVPAKLVGGVSGPALVLGVTAFLFLRPEVRWMPPAAALVAAGLSAFVGLSYSYLTELRQRRFILKAFAQSVSKEVADEIAKDPKKLGLGGQRREMSVMFTDLANFTGLAESMEDQKLTSVLQYYLQEMSGVVFDVNGTLDKYIGDAIMAFWNAPLNQPDHAVRACRAALEMRRREAVVQPKIREMAGVEVYSRIGINSGSMVVGNLGSTFKFAYTVIGDSVNLASRLEGSNKTYGTRVMLSETTAAIVKNDFVLRRLDLLRVKGKNKPINVFELIREGPPNEEDVKLVQTYERALAHYHKMEFEIAGEQLTALAKAFPGDGPTATLLSRIAEFRDDPPAPDWDGVYVAKEK